MVEFAYTGHCCELLFDVSGFTHYPAIFVQTDNGAIVKTTLYSRSPMRTGRKSRRICWG